MYDGISLLWRIIDGSEGNLPIFELMMSSISLAICELYRSANAYVIVFKYYPASAYRTSQSSLPRLIKRMHPNCMHKFQSALHELKVDCK